MPRYIDADALISDSRICGNCKDYELCDGNIAFCPNASARRAINDAPTADVEPVRHGQWSKQMLFDDGFGGGRVGYICSCCKQYVPYAGCYCGKCGAKMDGGEQE